MLEVRDQAGAQAKAAYVMPTHRDRHRDEAHSGTVDLLAPQHVDQCASNIAATCHRMQSHLDRIQMRSLTPTSRTAPTPPTI